MVGNFGPMVPWPTLFSPTGSCGIRISNPVWTTIDPVNASGGGLMHFVLMTLPYNPSGAPPFELDIQMLLVDFSQPASHGVLPFVNMSSHVYRLSWD
jgi:hypothetical protein